MAEISSDKAGAASAADAAATRKTEIEGVAFAVAAYSFWGFVVILYAKLAHIDAVQLVAHRAVWCLLFLATVLVFRKSFGRLLETLKSPRLLVFLLLTSTLTVINWGVFVWAIGQGRILEGSLGYYINPLISVLLGVVLLGERLTQAQTVAIAIAAIAVAYFGISLGILPWVPLLLGCSFGLYGYFRKIIKVGPAVGLFVETLVMVVLALPYIYWLVRTGQSQWEATAATPWLLVATGPATALPLVWFTAAAQRVKLATVGMLQYLAPSIHFLLAAFAFGETITSSHLVTFTLIWTALAIFTSDTIIRERRMRKAA